jgi:iron complex transport system permease protein
MSKNDADASYFRRTSKWKLVLAILVVSLIATVVLSLNIGYARIPFSDILAILTGRNTSTVTPVESAIILKIRLPRILAGAVVGAALAFAGVVYQGVFKNPMADSYVLGVSAGAAVGATFSILFGLGAIYFGFSFTQVAAFLGAVLAMFLVYNLARVGSRVPTTTLLLCGIAVNFFLFAVVGLMEVIAGDELHAMVFWLVGGFSNVLWRDIWSILPFVVFGVVAVYFYARELNLMALGEETAQNLGVNIEKSKMVLLVLASLITAAAVSISGLIGFVGLMIPHLVRLVIGPDHRILLPTSAITGSIFLVVCDDLARVIATPFASTLELPVGIITMLAGAPFFILLLRRKKQSYAL